MLTGTNDTTFWMGGYAFDRTMDFVWMSGQKVPSNHWMSEPYGIPGECLTVFFGGFGTARCYEFFTFVCEKN